jgi:hypothetical protein
MPRAERSLVAVNPQVFAARDPLALSTLVVSASCKGVGQRFETPARVRLYHLFDCSLLVNDTGNGLLVRVGAMRWCAYTHHGIDEIVRWGGGWVNGCG